MKQLSEVAVLGQNALFIFNKETVFAKIRTIKMNHLFLWIYSLFKKNAQAL